MKGGEIENMKINKLFLASIVILVSAGSVFAQARNFRHERIIASDGFTGDGASITNIDPVNVQGTAVVGTDIGSTVQAYSANLDALAANNGAGLTNIPAAGVVGTAVVATDIGSTVQAYSANLDPLSVNDGGSLTNVTAAGGSVGGHTLYVWDGPTCSTYNVSADGSYTNWMGDTFP